MSKTGIYQRNVRMLDIWFQKPLNFDTFYVIFWMTRGKEVYRKTRSGQNNSCVHFLFILRHFRAETFGFGNRPLYFGSPPIIAQWFDRFFLLDHLFHRSSLLVIESESALRIWNMTVHCKSFEPLWSMPWSMDSIDRQLWPKAVNFWFYQKWTVKSHSFFCPRFIFQKSQK